MSPYFVVPFKKPSNKTIVSNKLLFLVKWKLKYLDSANPIAIESEELVDLGN
jgi:hypothetical protein